MVHAKLPIGIQDFETVITEGYTYVDKTELIYQLITRGKPYFLSRPRRFGKSLLVSTFHALFSGRRDLFREQWIDTSDWNWIEYPIIRLDMSTINNRTSEMFELDLIRALNEIAAEYSVTLTGDSPANYLQNLIKKLSVKQKVVVLIDEYDKPLIDNIEDFELAKKNRIILQQFYAILKAEDKHLKFVFLTGVTKFSKVSVFSGLNNLIDLSMLEQFSALLGYTREELIKYFSDDIEELAVKRGLTVEDCYSKIKEWYNGYLFSNQGERVYNPFSLLNLLYSKEFHAHWFETGTPSFLINLIKKRHFDLSNLEQINVDIASFSSFDIEDLPTLPLLYQTGYLTIKSFSPEINAYCLGFPNREVNQSFSKSLLASFSTSNAECSKSLVELSMNLRRDPWDHPRFFAIMKQIFALIPYDLYVKEEKYFHTLFYLTIKLAGFQIGAEIHTQQGRTDAVLECKDKVIIFEFKLNESGQAALKQIRDKKYYEFYQDRKLPIYLIGINFNGEKRSIEEWAIDQL
jgi:hypothetical protein